jgi:hypothetical protein
MKMRTLLSLSFVVCGASAFAGLDMDHFNPVGANLITSPDFGVMQIFPDFPTFSSTLVDDFTASGSILDSVDVAFELSNPNVNTALIQGWQVSVWSSKANALASGNNLNGNTVAQMLAAPVALGNLAGTGAVGTAKSVSLTNLNLGGLTVGTTYWIGVAPVLEFTASGGQTFILLNTAPALLGAGTANNAVGVNPGGAFGVGEIPANGNAAYKVTTVPEPATLIALGAGLAALARRRRK